MSNRNHNHRSNTNRGTGLIEDIVSYVQKRESGEEQRQEAAARKAEFDAKRVEDAKRRLAWILSDSLENGANEKDPFWMKVACTSWQARPRVTSTKELAAASANALVIKRGKQDITIGMIKFAPTGGVVGLKLYDFKGNVLFCHGDFEKDFNEETERWAPLLNDFYMLGDAKPPLF